MLPFHQAISVRLFLAFVLFSACAIMFFETTVGQSGQCMSGNFHIKNGLQDKTLYSDRATFKTTTVQNDPQCYSECSRDCRCMSFHVCGEACQLNTRSRLTNPELLRIKKGCRYYDMPAKTSCSPTSTTTPPLCCITKPPLCQNHGECAVDVSDTTRRFFCKCRPGFYGEQCQVRRPRSCLDYWVAPYKPFSGEYKIEDANQNVYNTFCDFDSEDGVAWSLVQSFSMSNEPEVINYPFYEDHHVNDKENFNWELYRLPKPVQVYIASGSTYWRSTCSFPVYGVDYKDYIRCRMAVINPTSFNLRGVTHTTADCLTMDYIDIKGTNCVNCTVAVFRLANEMMHANLWFGRVHSGCTFASSTIEHLCGNNEYPRLMGVYHMCSDPSHRCTETASSTTQTWFGEKKP